MGKGTGKHQGKTLYKTKALHAGLFPVTALMKTKSLKDELPRRIFKKLFKSVCVKQNSAISLNVYNTHHCHTNVDSSQDRKSVINYFSSTNLMRNTSNDEILQQAVRTPLPQKSSGFNSQGSINTILQQPSTTHQLPIQQIQPIIFPKPLLLLKARTQQEALYRRIPAQNQIKLPQISLQQPHLLLSKQQQRQQQNHYIQQQIMQEYFQQTQQPNFTVYQRSVHHKNPLSRTTLKTPLEVLIH